MIFWVYTIGCLLGGLFFTANLVCGIMRGYVYGHGGRCNRATLALEYWAIMMLNIFGAPFLLGIVLLLLWTNI
jgi:hypothetical protein